MSAVIMLIMIELTLPKSSNSKCGRTQSVNTQRLAGFLMTVTHSVCTGRPCSCLWLAPPRRRGVRRAWVRAPCTLCCAASRSRTCTLTTRSTRSSCRPLRETVRKTRMSIDRFSDARDKDAHKGHSEASFYRSFVHSSLISIAAPAETDNCRQINHFVTPGCSWKSSVNLMYTSSYREDILRQTLIKGKYANGSLCVSWRKGLELYDKTGSKQKLQHYLYKNIFLLFAGHRDRHISIKPPFHLRMLQRLLSSVNLNTNASCLCWNSDGVAGIRSWPKWDKFRGLEPCPFMFSFKTSWTFLVKCCNHRFRLIWGENTWD